MANAQDAQDRRAFLSSRRAIILAGGVIALAALAAYHNSFSGSFIFDDVLSITQNRTSEISGRLGACSPHYPEALRRSAGDRW